MPNGKCWFSSYLEQVLEFIGNWNFEQSFFLEPNTACFIDISPAWQCACSAGMEWCRADRRSCGLIKFCPQLAGSGVHEEGDLVAPTPDVSTPASAVKEVKVCFEPQ
jgi:hypothetical protein